MSKHLDLGCGTVPRNPYARDELFGIDLGHCAPEGPIRQANLATQPIPFESNSFDSISAYDFLEHIPRVLPTADGQSTRLPFVELMNEVWRVLRPGGLFYASTPVYPHPFAFIDPTHVNVFTALTHTYFLSPNPPASMYGFRGGFGLVRTQLAGPGPGSVYIEPIDGVSEQLKQFWRARRGKLSHVIWELKAQK